MNCKDLSTHAEITSLRKQPFLLALRRWGRFSRSSSRNVPSVEERGETAVVDGYEITGFDKEDKLDFMTKMLDSRSKVTELDLFLLTKEVSDLARLPLLNLFFCQEQFTFASNQEHRLPNP